MTERMKEVISNLSYVIGEETLAYMTAPYAKPFAPGKPPKREPPVDETEGVKGKSVLPGPEDEKGGAPEFYGKEKKVKELSEPVRAEQDQVRVPSPPSVEGPGGTSAIGKTPEPEKGGDPELYKQEKPFKALETYPEKIKEQGEKPPATRKRSEWKVIVGSSELDAVAAKIMEVLKGKAEAVRFRPVVRFEADEAGKDAAVEALKAVGLDVREIEED